MKTWIKNLIQYLKLKLKIMLSKDDAKAMTDAKKDAYIKGKALECIPVCIKTIRESIDRMEYKARIHIEGPEFIPDIILELDKVFNQLGYKTTSIGGRGRSMYINIFWSDSPDKET